MKTRPKSGHDRAPTAIPENIVLNFGGLSIFLWLNIDVDVIKDNTANGPAYTCCRNCVTGKGRPSEGEQAILRTDHVMMRNITYLEWLLVHLSEDRSML